MAEEDCTALLLGPDPPPPTLGPCRTYWIPVIRAEPVKGCARRLLEAGRLDFIAFTSPRAPRALSGDAEADGAIDDLKALVASVTVGAVGPRTALEVTRRLGVEPVMPPRYTGVELARLAVSLGARRLAWVRGSVYNIGFKSVVESHGIDLVEVEAYRVVVDEEAAEKAASRVGRHDFLVLTSPLIASTLLPRLREPPRRAILVIGPTTLKKALEAGLEGFEYCVPETYNLDGLALCVKRYITPIQ